MPIIKCGTNRVAADEPEDDHTHVQVVWFGPPKDGIHRTVFEGPLEPIEKYEEAVAWACEMAEQMVHPETGAPQTAHTTFVVPLVYVGERAAQLEDGRLCDLAPTLLTMMNQPQPEAMTGTPLLRFE